MAVNISTASGQDRPKLAPTGGPRTARNNCSGQFRRQGPRQTGHCRAPSERARHYNGQSHSRRPLSRPPCGGEWRLVTGLLGMGQKRTVAAWTQCWGCSPGGIDRKKTPRQLTDKAASFRLARPSSRGSLAAVVCLARNVSPGLAPGLLRATRRPGAVIFRPFPLHAITARNKAASFILRMHNIRATSPITRKLCPLTVQFRAVGPSAPSWSTPWA